MTIKTNTCAPGIEGNVTVETHLSSANGQQGKFLILADYPSEELRRKTRPREIVNLLRYDKVPMINQLRTFYQGELTAYRPLPVATRTLLRETTTRKTTPIDILRMAANTLYLQAHSDTTNGQLAIIVVAARPTRVFTYWGILNRQKFVEPDASMNCAVKYLSMVFGKSPSVERIHGLDTYLNTIIDQRSNASTFSAKVVTSNEVNVITAIVNALDSIQRTLPDSVSSLTPDMVLEIGLFCMSPELQVEHLATLN